ncbi:sigma factor G inhibitor Gin [Clostridium sp. AL.422]|uniref:sigma factor G inhibitor Gin n=1 Tax=Clostridium TaxID=1485 RepID=UPI00293DB175|nr:MULTISPECIES: sigma factor G inhibitor Gin [unclassified Clostridium]MDV4152266.1 sigma factor G inhibitor Gin [Clostridium sp. AL.422]
MKLENKTIDNDKNKCVVCSKGIYIDDIIINRSLFCHECYDIISNININDIEYDFYKERIKTWLLSKYNLIA